jgi:hypothetical protein
LHQVISLPPETLLEIAFLAQSGSGIEAAGESLCTFRATHEILHFHSAWTLYIEIYKKMQLITKEFSAVYLHNASPLLFEMANSELVVPGLDNALVTTHAMNSKVSIMRSKRLLRKVALLGSD